MKDIRKAATENPELKKELINSIDSIQRFLDNKTSRLSLHDQKFRSALSADDEDMKYFFEVIINLLVSNNIFILFILTAFILLVGYS